MTLLELLQLLKRHLKLVIILPVLCAIAMGLYAYLVMDNQYTAKTSMYVLASQSEDASLNLQTSLNASQMITNDVAALIKSDRVMGDAASELGLANLNGYDISVTSETTTRVLTLTVTGDDAQTAADIANAIAADVSDVAQEVMEVKSVNVVDEAITPDDPSGPNRKLYVAVALLAGLFVAVAIVVMQDMLNNKVRNAADAEELLGIPVLGQFPAYQSRR
ncbi:MAG: lipopolysaccharide biosynthesis protein [Coriobacteriia bacterium]|nr:lipopolysaccharide biosynthesis protein [Coriobacteriia bacterium]MBS5478709.1 lipopolysaccharide biosynthesis protein [Coriobacteriia bacterium]